LHSFPSYFHNQNTEVVRICILTQLQLERNEGNADSLDAEKLRAIGLALADNVHIFLEGRKRECMPHPREQEEARFAEFRRKVREAEVLSAAMERLLTEIQFNGKVSAVVQNGRVLKSGYEEGYFRNRP